MSIGDLQHFAEVVAERDALKAKLVEAEATCKRRLMDMEAQRLDAMVARDDMQDERDAAIQLAADIERRAAEEIAAYVEIDAGGHRANLDARIATILEVRAAGIRAGAYRKQGARDGE